MYDIKKLHEAGSVGQAIQLLADHPDADLMLVGHEPDFSLALAQLTGGTLRMAKAGLARVDLENTTDLRGELVWLIPPKVLKEI